MQITARLAAVLAALLAAPALAQQSGDRITFSKPTDKVNRVDERRRVDAGRRAEDLPAGGLGSDGVAATAPASPALSRAQVEALKKLQAERDWALQDLQPAGEGRAGAAEDSGRLSIDDLFDRSQPARNPGRTAAAPDNNFTSSQSPAGAALRRPAETALEPSPRARSILDGGTLFDRRPGTPDNLSQRILNDPVASPGLAGSAKTAAERRTEQRMLNFREMLRTSVFAPASPRPEGTPDQALGLPGLNSQLNPGVPARTGIADEQPAARKREDGLFVGGVAPTRPNFTAFTGPGTEAGSPETRGRVLPEVESGSPRTVPVPKFEIPRPKF